jgi:hypothetical protein
MVVGPPKRATGRIASIVNSAKARVSAATISRNISYDHLTPSNTLRQAIDHWKGVRDCSDRNQFTTLLRGTLESRFVLFKTPKRSEEFIVEAVGDGLPPFAHEWLSRTIGMRVQDQPDNLYGQSCAETYAQALHRQEPKLEDVDAVATWPGYGPVRRRYKRVILPFRHEDGGTRVLSATLPDSSIDLRRAVG